LIGIGIGFPRVAFPLLDQWSKRYLLDNGNVVAGRPMHIKAWNGDQWKVLVSCFRNTRDGRTQALYSTDYVIGYLLREI
jgi:hypothetical protein